MRQGLKVANGPLWLRNITSTIVTRKGNIKVRTAQEQDAIQGNRNSRVPLIAHRPRSGRYYYDVAIGSVCLTAENTGGSYCLFELSLGTGKGIARHTHTREDESYYVLSGELEVVVGDKKFVLKPGDALVAPRNIPHELRNPGSVDNHYLNLFSPAAFEGFLDTISVSAPDGAVAPSEPQAAPNRNVGQLLAEYGIRFS
jgi:mannose-6-phosphate isomerase-like protein (cupin superfamily)